MCIVDEDGPGDPLLLGHAPDGLGLHLDDIGGRPAVFHEGGTVSFSSWLAHYPNSGLTISVLSNTLGPNAATIEDLVVNLTSAVLQED